MAVEVVMPRLGWNMEAGSLVRWLKQDGEPVRAGEVICLIESDKGVNEVESLDSGILRIPLDSPPPGVEVPVGTVLAYLVGPGEPAPFGLASSVSPIAREQGSPGQDAAGAGVSTHQATPATIVPASPTDSGSGDRGPTAGVLGRSGATEPGAARPRVEVSRPTPRAVEQDGGAAAEPGGVLTKERLLALYRQMVEIRRCEEELAKAHQRGLIHGACHTYVGEEAIASGVCAHLRPDDTVLSTHRGHGHALAKGVRPRELMAELFGRVTGCSRGRGGSMHLFAPEVGLLGTSGIVGPSILLATGAAYTFRLLKTDRVSVAFFGDGASNNGAFHEGLNLAAIWRLPVVFVCENNQYATEVPLNNVAGNPHVAERAVAYDLPGVRVDGNDVVAVYEVAGEAVRRARAGEGPTLLEGFTYRTRAHAEGMRDAGYRTRAEIEEWQGRCPIKRLRERLIAGGAATAGELDRIDAEVEAIVADARQYAEASPWPDPATATRHVYSGGSDACAS
ncbi:MAG: hypothetical protein HYY04_18230 [Chloroflexi bacterium]|nr:hypothetical protein [Chloroflexota bacterium]